MIEKLQISPKNSIKHAMKQMDLTGKRILVVVGAKRKLLGVLTDGDIRRWLLKNGRISASVSSIYNKNPRTVLARAPLEQAKALMLDTRIDSVPVIDDEGKVVDILLWEKVFSESRPSPPRKMKVPVVIMAGGKGTRLEPFTHILPKPLIPIGEKPLVQIIMEHFDRFGCNEFHLTINYKGDMIRSFFSSAGLPYKLHYVKENTPLGTGGSLRLLPKTMPATFFVSNCDIIIKADYLDMLRFHREEENEITIISSMQHYRIPYGVIEQHPKGQFKAIREKPEYDFLINTGMYILEKSVLALIPPKEADYPITHLIEAVKKAGRKVGIYPISEKSYFDIGQWEEYHKTMAHFKEVGA